MCKIMLACVPAIIPSVSHLHFSKYGRRVFDGFLGVIYSWNVIVLDIHEFHMATTSMHIQCFKLAVGFSQIVS